MKSHHFIDVHINWASPVEIMALAALVIVCFIRFCPERIRMLWGFSLQEKEIEVDEDLPNFFRTILLS
jgi:hypothetical protein